MCGRHGACRALVLLCEVYTREYRSVKHPERLYSCKYLHTQGTDGRLELDKLLLSSLVCAWGGGSQHAPSEPAPQK